MKGLTRPCRHAGQARRRRAWPACGRTRAAFRRLV